MVPRPVSQFAVGRSSLSLPAGEWLSFLWRGELQGSAMTTCRRKNDVVVLGTSLRRSMLTGSTAIVADQQLCLPTA